MTPFHALAAHSPRVYNARLAPHLRCRLAAGAVSAALRALYTSSYSLLLFYL